MFVLPALPYATTALEPYMSSETLLLHHGQHHRNYVDTLNSLITGTPHANAHLVDIILATGNADNPDRRKIFDNAAQHWNHTFFWNGLSPQGGGEPLPGLASAINQSFGSFEDFKLLFRETAISHFGSGWAWLVQAGDELRIMATHDADTPLATGQTAIVCCDLWEHAYYLDHRNRRPDYIHTFLDHLINWDFAEAWFDGEAARPSRKERFEELSVLRE